MSRQEAFEKELKKYIAQYIEEHANKDPMITVTRCELTKDMKKLECFLSVFPDAKEEVALAFAKRELKNIQNYLRKKLATRSVPFVTMYIDPGEKLRYRMDELNI